MAIKEQARQILPPVLWRAVQWAASQGRWARERLQGEEWAPPRGMVRFGSFRRVRPFNRVSGGGRGLPLDRYYVESFLERRASDIQGRVLEIAEPMYTRRYGGDRVTRSEVLHVAAGESPYTTIVGDLTSAENVPSDAFDCVVLTQTLHLIYDVRAAIATLHRIVKPGGVVLATFPGLANISRPDMDRWGQYWNFTSLAARRAFEEGFPGGEIEVEAHGNVLVTTAFLYGLATEELTPDELEFRDEDYEFMLTVRAMKAAAPAHGTTAA